MAVVVSRVDRLCGVHGCGLATLDYVLFSCTLRDWNLLHGKDGKGIECISVSAIISYIYILTYTRITNCSSNSIAHEASAAYFGSCSVVCAVLPRL